MAAGSFIEFLLNLVWLGGEAYTLASDKSEITNARFLKMNGAGNDFVVFENSVSLTPEKLRAIADRANPVTKGCDQVIVLSSVIRDPSSVSMRIYNADGGEVESCGNATRCAAWLSLRESERKKVTVETAGGLLVCERAGENLITVDMGEPRLAHAKIPAAKGLDLENISAEGLERGMAVGMGNPHVVFFVPDVAAVDLSRLGPLIEHRTDLFPNRVNVSVAQVIAPGHITLRVWERGAGQTLACGTAACATLVAAAKRGLTGRKADIAMPGGTLSIDWRADNHVWMTGPVELEFEGNIEL